MLFVGNLGALLLDTRLFQSIFWGMSLPSCQPDAQHSSTLQLTLIFACWETRRNHATAMHSFRLQMFQRQHGPTRKTAAAYRLPAQSRNHSCSAIVLESHWGPASQWPNWTMLIQPSQRMSRSLRLGYRWKIGFGDLALLWHLFFRKKQLCNTLLGAPVWHLLPGSGLFQAVLFRWCVFSTLQVLTGKKRQTFSRLIQQGCRDKWWWVGPPKSDGNKLHLDGCGAALDTSRRPYSRTGNEQELNRQTNQLPIEKGVMVFL